jgi:MbtH protein
LFFFFIHAAVILFFTGVKVMGLCYKSQATKWAIIMHCVMYRFFITFRKTKIMPARNNENEDITIYKVVVNHEEQYSIWPAHRELPLGWNEAGKSGTKEECLAYIKEVWTDMRPLSLRKKMEEMEKNRNQQ